MAEEQKAQLDSAFFRIAELKNGQDAASVSTDTCCKELLQVQKNLATVLEKVKDSSACAIAAT